MESPWSKDNVVVFCCCRVGGAVLMRAVVVVVLYSSVACAMNWWVFLYKSFVSDDMVCNHLLLENNTVYVFWTGTAFVMCFLEGCGEKEGG